MTLYQSIFYLFAAGAALAAIGVLFSKNLFHAALWLVVCLLSIAAIYVLAYAEFVAVTQILVYAGGIVVVIIFGIMLTAKFGQVPLRVQHKNIFSGFLLTVPLLAVLAVTLKQFPSELPDLAPIDTQPETIQSVGIALLTEQVLVFEIAGILLLMALIGAAVIASHKTRSS